MLYRSKKSKAILWTPVDYKDCLAKTEIHDGMTVRGMSVLQHSIAAGRTAEALAEAEPYLRKCGFFPDGYDTLAALHDVGKVSPAFQYGIGMALNKVDSDCLLTALGLHDFKSKQLPCAPTHAAIGYGALINRFGDDDKIANVVRYHHGSHDDSGFLDDCAGLIGGVEWHEARSNLIDKVEEVFGCRLPHDLSSETMRFLTGFTIVSDWISSSVSLAQYEYGGDAVFPEQIRKIGIQAPRIRKGLSFEDVFSFQPRSEQSVLLDAISGPGTYVLEAGTGSGKTEAALYAAYIQGRF